MSTSTKIGFVLTALAVIVLGIVILTRPMGSTTSTTQSLGAISNSNAPAAGTVLANGVLLPNPTVLDYFVSRVFLYTDKALGFGNSTSIPILQQGVRQAALTAATTTPCNLQSPFTTATSTFEAWMNVTTATGTAQSIEVATAAVPNALTVVVAQGVTLAANNQGIIGFDTIASSTGQIVTVSPSGWVAIGSPSGTALTYGGTCGGLFTAIQ